MLIEIKLTKDEAHQAINALASYETTATGEILEQMKQILTESRVEIADLQKWAEDCSNTLRAIMNAKESIETYTEE